MSLFGLLTPPFSGTPAHRDVAARYKRLRPIRLDLNNKLVERLSRDALNEGAKILGLLRGGVFVFDDENEMSALMDYCIYDIYRNGRNAVDQYLHDCPPDSESEEMVCLRAMQQATYTLIAVQHSVPRVGCQIQNLFTDETQLLADVGFSKSAQPGVLLATRLLDFGDFVTTSGVALPVGILRDDELNQWKRKLRSGVNADRYDPAELIRACLRQGASSRVRYEELDAPRQSDTGQGISHSGLSIPPRRALEKRHKSKPATNRRCRCGSGKMFKNCCGKRESQLREGK
jgi:hypothetical protein